MRVCRADKWFLLLLVLAGIGLSAGIYMPRTASGSYVEIRVDGVRTAAYPLSSNRTQTISGADGGLNTFEIRNGIVTMREADCHDKVCVGMKGISKTGETIVCLPHKLVLAIVATDEEPSGPDAVTGSRGALPAVPARDRASFTLYNESEETR